MIEGRRYHEPRFRVPTLVHTPPFATSGILREDSTILRGMAILSPVTRSENSSLAIVPSPYRGKILHGPAIHECPSLRQEVSRFPDDRRGQKKMKCPRLSGHLAGSPRTAWSWPRSRPSSPPPPRSRPRKARRRVDEEEEEEDEPQSEERRRANEDEDERRGRGRNRRPREEEEKKKGRAGGGHAGGGFWFRRGAAALLVVILLVLFLFVFLRRRFRQL